MNFVDKDGQNYRPIVIHRALLGSIERFFGILIEHYAGNFPLWLAPTQVMVLPIADRHFEFAEKVVDQLRNANLRVETDKRNEKIGFKIREAEVQKIPYMLIIGDKEVESGQVSVRHKGEGDLGSMDVDQIRDRLLEEIKEDK